MLITRTPYINTFTLKLLLCSNFIRTVNSAEQFKLMYQEKGGSASEIKTVNLLSKNDSHTSSGKLNEVYGGVGCEMLQMQIEYSDLPINATPEMLADTIYATRELTLVSSDGNKIKHDGVFMNEVNLADINCQPNYRSERDKAIVNLQIEVNKRSDVTFTFSQVSHYIGSDMCVDEINDWYYDTKHGDGVTQEDIIDLCVDL